VGGGLILGMDLARIALDFVVSAVTLQFGFLAGAGARSVMTKVAASQRPARPPAPRAVR
jgi:hypothetical protein